MKKYLCLFISFCLILCLCGCGVQKTESNSKDLLGNAGDLHCTFSISCKTLADNIELCDETKKQCVPEDGWILEPVEASFSQGESVYDVLLRLCKDVYQIHLEYSFTPIYDSVYIEGINNLYEFDGGNLSGWMYKVNEWFPNYGCSRYELKDGDVVCWEYTCDLGDDIGGGYVTQ